MWESLLKFLRALLLFFFLPAIAHSAIAVVQTTNHVCSGSVASCGTTINGVGAGNALIVGIVCGVGTDCVTGTVSDDKSNTYPSLTNVNVRTALTRAVSVASGNTLVTFTPPTSNYIGLAIMRPVEWIQVRMTGRILIMP